MQKGLAKKAPVATMLANNRGTTFVRARNEPLKHERHKWHLQAPGIFWLKLKKPAKT
jgi:hypothetical protein